MSDMEPKKLGVLRNELRGSTNAMMPDSHSRMAEAHSHEIFHLASKVRVAELFRRQSAATLYWNEDRYGITTVGIRTTSLNQKQLVDVLQFRLAQYLKAGQLDPRLIFERRLKHEPADHVTAEDIHFLSGLSETGEILAYGTFKAPPTDASSNRISESGRPLFPVEETFGRGIFNRLKILPDLPLRRVREAGRLMKNHCTDAADELMLRAPIELLLGAFKFASAVTHEFDACIGDIEMGVAKKAQDYFQLPTILIHGAMPYCEESSFGFFNYQNRARHPYAFLCSDISAHRLAAINAALSQPGRTGIEALITLRSNACAPRSSLEPEEGLQPLNRMELDQVGVPMSMRLEMLQLGEWLKRTEPFRSLTVAEAASLGTLMHRITFAAGEALSRCGVAPLGLTFIEQGTVALSSAGHDHGDSVVIQLGPLDYFGEASVLRDWRSTFDIVSMTSGAALVLRRDVYSQMLSSLPGVHEALMRKALERCAFARHD